MYCFSYGSVIFYVSVLIAIIAHLIIDTAENRQRLIPLIGLTLFLVIGFITSFNRKAVSRKMWVKIKIEVEIDFFCWSIVLKISMIQNIYIWNHNERIIEYNKLFNGIQTPIFFYTLIWITNAKEKPFKWHKLYYVILSPIRRHKTFCTTLSTWVSNESDWPLSSNKLCDVIRNTMIEKKTNVCIRTVIIYLYSEKM